MLFSFFRGLTEPPCRRRRLAPGWPRAASVPCHRPPWGGSVNDRPPAHQLKTPETIAYSALLASTQRLFGTRLAGNQAATRGSAGLGAGWVIFSGMGSMAVADAAGPAVVGAGAVTAMAAGARSRPVRRWHLRHDGFFHGCGLQPGWPTRARPGGRRMCAIRDGFPGFPGFPPARH